MQNLKNEFSESFEDWHSDIAITARECENETYEGIEYEFKGNFVPVEPIVDVIEETDGHAIDELAMKNEEEVALIIFVADVNTDNVLAWN